MKAYIISHTHWDREWYQTFQDYRARLVIMLDELIGFMEKNPAYNYFHLDGQTIVLEDYLEVRPENRERLQRLMHVRHVTRVYQIWKTKQEQHGRTVIPGQPLYTAEDRRRMAAECE